MEKKYRVASPEGSDKYGAEEGATVTLELTEDEELALVAAGWLEPATTEKKGG